MSFLVKGVVKKILEQYLNIKDQIDLEKGSIVLANGHLNHQKINNKIHTLNLEVTQSLYKNLSLSIPIIDIMTKPIFLKVQKLQVVLVYKRNLSEQPLVQSGTTPRQSGSDSYLKVIANRLLMNIEVQIESMQVIIKKQDSEVVHRGHIQKFKVKNSLSFLNVNLLKKIVYLNELELATSDGSVKIRDLNLCFNLDDKKIGLIMLVQMLELNVQEQKLLKKIKQKISKKVQRRQQEKGKLYIEQLQIKVNKLCVLLQSDKTIGMKGKSVQVCYKDKNIGIYGNDLVVRDHEGDVIVGLVAQLDEQEQAKTKMKNFKIEVNNNKKQKHTHVNVKSIGIDFNIGIIVQKITKYKRIAKQIKEIVQMSQQMGQDYMEQHHHKNNNNSLSVSISNTVLTPLLKNNTKINISLSLQVSVNKKYKELNINSILVNTNSIQTLSIQAFKLVQSKQEVILNGKHTKLTLTSSIMHQLDNIIQQLSIIKSLQPQNNSKQLQHRVRQRQKNVVPVYMKLDRIVIQLGIVDMENIFFTIFQVEIGEVKAKHNKHKSSIKTSICHITAFSPHDLSTSSICRDIRLQVQKKGKSTSLNIMDPLNIQLSQQLLILAFMLINNTAGTMMMTIKNEINEQILIEQKSTQLPSFMKLNQNVSVRPKQQRTLFLTQNPSAVVIVVKGQKSRPLSIEYNREGKELDVNFSYHQQSQHVLSIHKNKLSLKYKYELIVYDKLLNNKISQLQIINANNDNEQLKMLNIPLHNNHRFTWELLENEKIGFLKVFIKYKHTHNLTQFRVCKLMANHQSYRIYGLYKQELPKYYYHYLLQTPKAQNTQICKYVLMPFLLLKNSLNIKLSLKIGCKKTEQTQVIQLKENEDYDALGNKFDFYMKQYVFQVIWKEEQVVYASDEHYFNTFFMVDEQFQTLVELRNQKDNNKKYMIIRESFLYKTKVFEFSSSFQIDNKLDYDIGLMLKNREHQEYHSSHLNAHKKQQYKCRPAKDDNIYILFEGKIQNAVQINMKKLLQVQSLLLSFNFCKINEEEQYYNIIVKVCIKNRHCHQIVTLSPFVILHNYCTRPLTIQQKVLNYEQSIALALPSSTSNQYNNKCIQYNIQEVYQELFHDKNHLLHTGQGIIQISMKSGEVLKFNELIRNKIVESECEGRRIVYCLLKNIKDDYIQFYLSDKLYNSPTSSFHYLLFNNETQHNFLMSSDTHYAQYILQHSKSQTQKTHETIFLSSNTYSSMLNKQKYDLLLCDKEQKNIQEISIPKLQKIHTKLERHVMDNFTVINLENDIRYENPICQISTKRISVKLIGSKNKKKETVGLGLQLKFLNLRILEHHKIDVLLRDISVKCSNAQSNETNVLRIADESYVLIESKLIAEKFIFLKNLFLKCKLVDVHLSKQFIQSILYFYKFIKEFTIEKGMEKKDSKIMSYMEEKVVLIKSMNLHSMNLCLSTDINNLDFSNMIVLPEFELSNKSYRLKSLTKDMTNHYLTNVLAKFPKLSFIFQNLRNPLATIKSLFEARQLLKEEEYAHSFIHLKENWNCGGNITKINKQININPYIREKLCFQTDNESDKNERIICSIKNAVFNSIKNLGIISYYYLTNMNIIIIGYEQRTGKSTAKYFPLKSIAEAKLMKYNNKDGELVIEFKRKLGYLKIVDKMPNCESILSKVEKVLF